MRLFRKPSGPMSQSKGPRISWTFCRIGPAKSEMNEPRSRLTFAKVTWGGAISNPVAGVALRWKSTRRSAVIEGRICPRLSPRVLKSTLACA